MYERTRLGAHHSRVARSNPGNCRSVVEPQERANYEKKRRIRSALAKAGYTARVERIGEEVVVIWS
jgi:hypothetical protein